MPPLSTRQNAIVRALAQNGGSMRGVDLLSEVAGGGDIDVIRDLLQELVEAGLIDGPTATRLDYRLTAEGWRFIGRP
jgi:hypothetical protein